MSLLYIKQLTNEEINKLITYLKDWITNARHCYTSQIILNSLFRIIKYDNLYQNNIFIEALNGLISYS